MAKYPTLLEQFRSFYFQNNPKDLEKAVEYFSIFGGMGWNVDTDKAAIELIESKILKNYTYIHGDITKVTNSDKVSHSLLSGVAMGDRRMHSALKRARISRQDGERVVENLCDMGFLSLETSLEGPPSSDRIDDKLNFSVPFMRFWFSFISPFFKGIKDNDYAEVKKSFSSRESEFCNLTFESLSKELLKKSFKENPIMEIGSYWDRNVEIDILAKTKSGKIVAGACKYSNVKANKTDLTKLKEKCATADLTSDIYVLFSKSGFSNELKNEKGADVKLYALKNFKGLVENLSERDFIECIGKRY
ncbi:MAG: ATPase [Helicobacteraceae bacterium CG2_30_36_10]|nr:MAG: ATPase [Helicobacteraceae bacterium CG2_30_36_10]